MRITLIIFLISTFNTLAHENYVPEFVQGGFKKLVVCSLDTVPIHDINGKIIKDSVYKDTLEVAHYDENGNIYKRYTLNATDEDTLHFKYLYYTSWKLIQTSGGFGEHQIHYDDSNYTSCGLAYDQNCKIDKDYGFIFTLNNSSWQPIEWAILEFDGDIIARGSSKYDSLGNLTEDYYIHTYNASPSFRKYANEYDDNGKLVIRYEYDQLKNYDEPKIIEKYEYDELDRMIFKEVYYVHSHYTKELYDYDMYNNIIKEIYFNSRNYSSSTLIYEYSK